MPLPGCPNEGLPVVVLYRVKDNLSYGDKSTYLAQVSRTYKLHHVRRLTFAEIDLCVKFPFVGLASVYSRCRPSTVA
jgi:hypothetical protein